MVLLMTVIAGGAALAIDIGVAYVSKEKVGSVLDAAALAAAAFLPDSSSAQAAAAAVVEANGLDAAVITVTTPVSGDSSRVAVGYTGQQASFFGRVLGIAVFPISSQSVAMGGGPAVFDYALFSGSTGTRLDVTGVTVNVTGHAHSNHDFRIRGATVIVSGRLEAARRYDARGCTVQAGSIADWVPIVPMPQYDVNELRAMCGTRYSGDQHWSGQVINLSGGVFIDGNLKLSGVTLQGRGLLIVNGNVHFAGTTFRYTGPQDAVCLYSLGNIRVTGVSFTADGIIYAPQGSFEAHGATVNVNGSIIADTIDLAGMTLNIAHDAGAKSVFPGGPTKLTR